MWRRIALPIGLVVMIAAGAGGFYWWYAHRPGLPPYIVKANGRLELARTDIAVKYPGRIVELSVHEGDRVARDQILAHQDDAEINAQLAGARAKRAQALSAIAKVKANVDAHRSKEALEHGRKTLRDVLDDRITALSDEDGWVQAEMGRATATVQLYRALGGGW